MEWINVEDRLPGKQTERYLVKTKCSHRTHVTLAKNWAYPCNEINIAYYDDWTKWHYESGVPWEEKVKVTHWMPLPNPPEK